MIDLALRNIRMRRTRSVLTVLGVSICIFLIVFIMSITALVQQDLQNTLASYTGQIYVKSQALSGWQGEEFPPLSSSIDETTANSIISTTSGINRERSSPILFVTLAPPSYPGAPPQAIVVGIVEGKEKAYIGGVGAESGLASFEGGEKEAILGVMAASLYQVDLGEAIKVSGETLKVRGLLESSGILVVDGAILIPLPVAQNIFHRNGSVSAVLLTSETLAGVGAIADSVREGFPKLQVVTQEDMAKNLDAQLTNMRTFMDAINNAVLAVAVIIVLVVMIITVMERTREIGTFRAIGTPRYKILLMILSESVIISLFGFIAGVSLSYVIIGNWWGWSFYANFILGESQVLLQAAYIALIIGALAGLYPAYRAARISPLEAMRYE